MRAAINTFYSTIISVVLLSTASAGEPPGIDDATWLQRVPDTLPTTSPECEGPDHDWADCVHVTTRDTSRSLGTTTATCREVYDDAGQVVRVEVNRNSDDDVDQLIVYERDEKGRILRITVDEKADGELDDPLDEVHVYTRNPSGQVVRYEQRTSGAEEPGRWKTWEYDGAGHVSRSEDLGFAAQRRTLICEYDGDEPERFGVDWDEDGHIDVDVPDHQKCRALDDPLYLEFPVHQVE